MATPGPVTDAEARATFKRVIANLPALAGKPYSISLEPIPDDVKPVTRESVVLEFMRIYSEMSPSFKFTPRPVWYDVGLVTIKTGAARKALDLFIKDGFVGRVAPLATSKTDSLSVDDFGDALGFFVSRLADLTHMPDPEYTPILEPG